MGKMHWKGKVLIAMMVASLLFAPVINAAPIPWKTDKYSHFSDQENVSDVLKALAAFQEVPIVISPKIKDVVSLHFKERPPEDLFKELVKTYGLTWYYDKESLFVYKEDEVQNASVSLKNMKPSEFTNTLKRLEILDEGVPWKISEVDNVIYFSGPEKFVSAVLNMAQVVDNQPTPKRKQIYRWKDNKGTVNFSSEDPITVSTPTADVETKEKLPGFDIVDIVKNKK